MKNLLLIIVSVMLLIACGNDDDSMQPVTDITTSIDNDFSLAYGGTANIPAENISITFDDIEESRCPTNVTCITAGVAEVTLKVKKGSEEVLLKLNVEGGCFEANNCTGEIKEALGFQIKLISVSPHPINEDLIDDANYSAKLTVTTI